MYFASREHFIPISSCVGTHSFTYSVTLSFYSLFSSYRKGLKACIILAPLLGLTWVFGLLTATDAGLVFQYIFTILNSTQVGVIMIAAHREPLYRMMWFEVDLSPSDDLFLERV